MERAAEEENQEKLEKQPPQPQAAAAAAAAAEEAKQEEEFVVVVDESSSAQKETTHHVSKLQTQPRTVAPIQVAPRSISSPTPQPPPPPLQSIGTGIGTASTLNSRKYTNRISLLIFLLHLAIAGAAIAFFVYKAVQVLLKPKSHRSSTRKVRRALQFWLPPIEGSVLLGIALAFAWQISIRSFPTPLMINFVLWSTFLSTLAAGIMLLCFALPSASGLGIALVLFAVGVALYSCWATRRIQFTATILGKALLPVSKFGDLNGPAYLMLGAGFLYITVWCFAVIGAQNFYYPPLTILALVGSLAWTVEVMRNVVNLTVSRVIALYYLRGMQASTHFCFQRALTVNLGSASLGSFFVPTIEALRIIARGLNLMEEEDEFMFSCAHCCLRVMEHIFHYGNSWAFVHIAAYGKGFVSASKSTWGLFERQRMEELVDSDMTGSVCFLTGVSSGALCVVLSASWAYATHKHYTATVSLLAFLVGFLMTRIAMALPHACVACYYVCYAENPNGRLFDSTIPDQVNLMRTDREMVASTPRFRHRR